MTKPASGLGASKRPCRHEASVRYGENDRPSTTNQQIP